MNTHKSHVGNADSSRSSKLPIRFLLAVGLAIAAFLVSPVFGLPQAMRFGNVATAELVDEVQREFEIQFEPLNTGVASYPFSNSPDADQWHTHSKEVTSYFSYISDAVKAGEIQALTISIDHATRRDNWFEPRLSIKVLANSKCSAEYAAQPRVSNEISEYCHTNKLNKTDGPIFQSHFEVSFHQIDNQWRIRAVWSPEPFFHSPRDPGSTNLDSMMNRYCRKASAPIEEQCVSDQGPTWNNFWTKILS